MKIVCLGDSITCNWNEKSYTDYWQELINKANLKHKIINAGINGETAQDGYYRLHRDAIDHKPGLLTVMFGHNDTNQAITPDNFERFLEKIIAVTRHHLDAKVWLLTPNKINYKPRLKEYEPYLSKIKEIAEEYGAEFIDIWKSFPEKGLDELYTYKAEWSENGMDYVHPNAKGHQLIAKTLMNQLVNSSNK